MKKSLLLGTLIAALGFSQAANAALWTTADYRDVVPVGIWLSDESEATLSYSGSFNILAASAGNVKDNVDDKFGFAPLSHVLSEVEVGFAFHNEQDAMQVVKISLGGIVGGQNVSSGEHEFLFGIDSVFFQGSLWGVLQSTGILDWTVSIEDTQLSDRVFFRAAVLGANVATRSASVPDAGSTFAFLSLAVFGLVVVNRRRAMQ